MRPLLLILALVVARPLAAQATPVQIDPGMTRAEVVERLGRPATERSSGGFTYLFFINGCERTCGMNDLVTLQGDSVVDAIFRAPHRSYSGRSTSPAQSRTPRANRGSLAVEASASDSVVLRIVPADSTTPPPPRRPIVDLTNRTIVPGGRADSAPATRLPSDQPRPPATQAPARVPPGTPTANPTPAGPPPQTGGTINPPALRPDTTRNTPAIRPDTTRGERIPVTRSDTVMNPRTPAVLVPRADTAARRPAGPPPTPPPPTHSRSGVSPSS